MFEGRKGEGNLCERPKANRNAHGRRGRPRGFVLLHCSPEMCSISHNLTYLAKLLTFTASWRLS